MIATRLTMTTHETTIMKSILTPTTALLATTIADESIPRRGSLRRLTVGLITASLLALLLSPAQAQDGAYVLRIEAPFAATAPSWLPLRVSVQVKDGKPAAAFATAQQFNVAWHEVDVSGLELAGGAFRGAISVAFRRCDFAAAAQADAEAKQKNYRDQFSSIPAQVFQVSCPVGTLTGAAPGTVSWDKDLLRGPRAGGGSAPVRAWREPVVGAQEPLHVELFLVRWGTKGWAGAYDAMHGNASLLLRGTFTKGQGASWVALQAPERYAMQFADLLWRVSEADLKLTDDALSGKAVVAPDADAVAKLGPLSGAPNSGRGFHPFPAQPLQVSIQARRIGTAVVGTAQVINDGQTITTTVIGRVRAHPFAVHADRTPRTWHYTAETDPALVAAARQESCVPIRPGEPGKRLFWSDAVRFGGYDRFVEDGKTIVQFDGGPNHALLVLPEQEYRAKLREHSFDGIAAPTFDLKPVADAVKYQFVVKHVPRPGDPVKAFEHRFEAPVPWASLAPVWDKVPVHSLKSDAAPFLVTVTGLDAQGQAVGQPQTVSFRKKAAFEGPYHQLPRTYREAALLSARWLRDNPRNAFARVGVGEPGVGNAGGDGQLWYTTYGALYGGLVLAQVSPNPLERSEALEQAIEVGDLWLRSFISNYLPDTYKGWAFDQWVYGTSWLDLYRLTGDERYRAMVLEHARRIVAKQMPSGTWPEVDPVNGHVCVDPKTGRPFTCSIQGPSMQQWDPSSTLYYLGRIRQELRTDEFRVAEDKAYQWIIDNSLARMDWRKQGPHASEDHKMPWAVLPDCALHVFHYLALDLPGRPADWELMADLLRWSEDRSVTWGRQAHYVPGKMAPIVHPTLVHPVIDYSKNRDVQIRLARAFAMLAAHTGNPLHKAKAEALAGAVLVAQFPTTGQLPHLPSIESQFTGGLGLTPGSGDGGNKGEYATMELLHLAQTTEKP